MGAGVLVSLGIFLGVTAGVVWVLTGGRSTWREVHHVEQMATDVYFRDCRTDGATSC